MTAVMEETEKSLNKLQISEVSGEHEEEEEDVEDETAKELGAAIGFVDPSNFAVKHPLQNRWTLWYDNPSSHTGKMNQNNWSNQLKRVVTYETVEDFWRIFNNIRQASKLGLGSNYHVFKDTIEPTWEHEENCKGGKWLVTCKHADEQLDKMWLWTVLACIGENFEDETEICGCVVSIRKGNNRIALWTKTSQLESAQKRIGTQMKRLLELPENSPLGYQVHSDSLKRGSSFNNKPRYEV